ncbi:MAG: hypothetical protein ABIS01_07800 [Ferruginibacter sp.]
MRSLQFLSLHVHMGIVGWFLLMVIGVGYRLIPMFLISKYSNTKTLRLIYALINAGIVGFIIIYTWLHIAILYWFPLIAIILAMALFAAYCKNAYRRRIGRKVEEQMKISLLSVLMITMPLSMAIAYLAGFVFSRPASSVPMQPF